jgi:inorganic pyrophosphatase
MNLYHDIQPKNETGSYNAVIEIPNGSKNKYEIEMTSGILRLEKILQSKQFFIFDYGFIPQTLGGDGDPLDVIVLSSNALLPKLVVKIEPVGVMRMLDEGKVDDKIIAIIKDDYYWSKKIDDDNLKKIKYQEIENWFKIYKKIDGTELEISGFDSKNEAEKIIENAIKKYYR